MFFVLRHHFVPRHFYPEVRRKNPESRRKKAELGRILFETFFCTEQHDKTIQKFISFGIFFGLRHLFWESAEINAYRQVAHFFLPRGVCRYCGIDLATSVCWTQQKSKHRKQVFVGKVHVADVSSTICSVKISCYSLDEFGLMFS